MLRSVEREAAGQDEASDGAQRAIAEVALVVDGPAAAAAECPESNSRSLKRRTRAMPSVKNDTDDAFTLTLTYDGFHIQPISAGDSSKFPPGANLICLNYQGTDFNPATTTSEPQFTLTGDEQYSIDGPISEGGDNIFEFKNSAGAKVGSFTSKLD